MHCMTRRSVGRLLVSRSLRTPQTLHGTLCSQTSELDLREAHVTENRSASEDIMTKGHRTLRIRSVFSAVVMAIFRLKSLFASCSGLRLELKYRC